MPYSRNLGEGLYSKAGSAEHGSF